MRVVCTKVRLEEYERVLGGKEKAKFVFVFDE